MKRAKTRSRYKISDALWEKIEPLIPQHPNTHRFGGGRPRVPDRQAMDGIFFVLEIWGNMGTVTYFFLPVFVFHSFSGNMGNMGKHGDSHPVFGWQGVIVTLYWGLCLD